MDVKNLILNVIGLLTLCFVVLSSGASDKNVTRSRLQRCFMCRSRGELGSCKDNFNPNITLVEKKLEIGVEAVPCASGWCGKIVESEESSKEEYGVATQRFCFQRGPSDSEDRCAYTKWNYKRVLMCFCKGPSALSFNISRRNNFLINLSYPLTHSRRRYALSYKNQRQRKIYGCTLPRTCGGRKMRGTVI
ncbi:unnamed protein product [Phaedon cochleariae]|uniref:Uncharacterized protein n=1 Tax=Phaedon cochleariae TaxID=80249 RepID=A0A9N9SFL3_PHACE|nr:unnamed protein product [Phaedon cochleariae]